MAIYEREWYRGADRRAPSPPRSMVTTLLIVNVAVYVFQLLMTGGWEPIHGGLGLVPKDVFPGFRIWELVTNQFLHDPDNAFHIIFNMFILWMFGRAVEARLGRWAFLRFYLGAGVVASLAYVLLAYVAQVMGATVSPVVFGARPVLPTEIPAVGASGAVMGVLVYYTMLNPNALVYLWFAIPIRMKWMMVGLIALDLWGLRSLGHSTVAHSAHLGGALSGFLYYRYAHRLGRFFTDRAVRAEVRRERRPPPRSPDLQNEVDRLLEKISESGIDALSEKEKDFLKDASRRLRDRDR